MMIPEAEITVNSPASPLWLRPVGIVGMVFSYMEVSENEEQAIDTRERHKPRYLLIFYLSVIYGSKKDSELNHLLAWFYSE